MRFANVILVLVALLVCSSAAVAELGPSLGQQQESAGAATGQFDPRDLSGIWDRKEGDMGLSPDVPPMTPEGQARLDANLPARGTRLGEEPREGEHPGRARAVVPALSNDPMMQCNPQGFPRLFFQPLPVEFVHLDNRLMQFYQRNDNCAKSGSTGEQCRRGRTSITLDRRGMDTRLASGKETPLWSRRSVLMIERGSTTGLSEKFPSKDRRALQTSRCRHDGGSPDAVRPPVLRGPVGIGHESLQARASRQPHVLWMVRAILRDYRRNLRAVERSGRLQPPGP